jgi:glycosyltransferase involved in cell wall biosynthesis
VERVLGAALSASYEARSRERPPSLARWLGIRIIVLKPKVSPNERGVLLAKFSEMLELIATEMDLVRLFEDYTLVVEPSWSGYCREDLLHFTQFDSEVFIESPEISDFEFLQRLNSNLVPVFLGSGDWVNPELLPERTWTPRKDRPFDVVMNANWAPWKRHYVLFETMSKLHRKMRVALIGFPWNGRTSDDIMALAEHYGVAGQITVFEGVPFEEVLKVNAAAKVAVLLSLKEGANRAIPEALFCGTPALVLQETLGGVAKNVTAESGRIVPQSDFASALDEMLEAPDSFSPRSWALEHISCFKSTSHLNQVLREHALARGEPWTRDIVAKTNRPELAYTSEEDAAAMASHNRALVDYLRVHSE